MNLMELATLLGSETATDVEVRLVTHNSAWVTAGDVYVALRGINNDGHSFIDDAVERGAVAVIGEGLPAGISCQVPYLTVANGRSALAEAAAFLQGDPSEELFVVGVTGTDGKTTTSLMARHLLRAAGQPTGLISTVGYERADGILRQPPVHFTTPEAPQVQQILREIADNGGKAAVVESSSHALVLERVGAIDFDVAIWTQLTQEHLDFHGTVDSYFAAKRKLVERARFAILNNDDPWVEQLHGVAAQEWTYSAEGREADWIAKNIVEEPLSLSFDVVSPIGDFSAVLPMIGRFNIANALAAMAAAARAGATAEQLVEGLRTFAGVPGRMELVAMPNIAESPRVIVDFAHTPPSLEKALATVRATTQGKLWVVIGAAGGNRDPKKRAPLGAAATKYADHAVFTEEDYRWTPVEEILAEMARGAKESGSSNYEMIADRTQAIRHAIGLASAADTVLLAGKGPESTIERGYDFYPWNEIEEARQALQLRAGMTVVDVPAKRLPQS